MHKLPWDTWSCGAPAPSFPLEETHGLLELFLLLEVVSANHSPAGFPSFSALVSGAIEPSGEGGHGVFAGEAEQTQQTCRTYNTQPRSEFREQGKHKLNVRLFPHKFHSQKVNNSQGNNKTKIAR